VTIVETPAAGVAATIERGFALAKELALEAGAILRDRLNNQGEVVHKGLIDLVTDVDKASEALISARLRQAFPEHRLTGEEGAAGATASIEEQPFGWVIDPLDGTTNYAHRFPHFAVSICLEYRGEPVAGAVYDPMRDELFAARRGGGATLNDVAMHVSGTGDLQRAMLASGFSYNLADRAGQLVLWDAFSNRSQAVRRAGAAALDMCWVACGRLDGYWERPTYAWDIGAGVIIVREAGGTVTDLERDGFDLDLPEVLATNGLLHAQMRAVIQDVLGDATHDQESRE
jgi:myo-inositol-1(or 4)-monophosphatase